MSEIKPHFRIVVLNETRHWNEEMQKKAGVIFRAFLYDATRVVHCCEITPSYELFPLYTTPWRDDENGSVWTELFENEDNEVKYVHCHVINALSPDHFHDIGVWAQEEDETEDELRERVEEHYRCNVTIQFPKGFHHEPADNHTPV